MKHIIVLGRGRCGTSMIAGMLDRLGVDMKTGVRDEKRIRGYYEGSLYIAFLWKWANEFDEFVEGKPDKEFVKKHKEFIKSDFYGSKTKASLTLLPWLIQMAEIYVVVLYRDKISQAKSLKRNTWKIEINELCKSIDYFHERVEKFFKKHSHVKRLNLDFDYIIDNPVEVTKKIAEFIDVEYKKEASDFIDNKMRHYKQKK